MKGVTCNECGWVHMEVSRAYAEQCIKDFNEYAATLAPEQRRSYYGRETPDIASIEDYEYCHLCAEPYTNFRDTVVGDAPDGSTLGPIINRNE